MQARSSLSSVSERGQKSEGSQALSSLNSTDVSTSHWTRLHPVNSPEMRFGAAMTFDAADGYVLMFGGFGPGGAFGYGFLNQTWIFENETWTELHPVMSPSPRVSPAMTYDPADGYVVLFGGCGVVLVSTSSCPPALNDTWTYRNGVWVNITPTVSPPARYLAGMTYDEADGYVLLFGGESTSSQALGDTWEFRHGTWTELTPTDSPGPRDAFTLTYDASDGYVLLFGGVAFPDTWAYASGNWVNITTTIAPSPRFATESAFDPSAGFVVLFSGLPFAGGPLNDTWLFKGGVWTNVTSNVSPTWRSGSSLTFDSGTGQVILFGGATGNDTLLNDTWAYETAAILVSNPSVTFAIDPPSCGPIKFDGQPFSNGTSGLFASGYYLAQLNLCAGYRFQGWNASSGIIPQDPNSLVTEVSVAASGTLEAKYAAVYSIVAKITPANCGALELGDELLASGAETNLTSGSYEAIAPACLNLLFSNWESSGGVFVAESKNSSTTVMISGPGDIGANYISRGTAGNSLVLEYLGVGFVAGGGSLGAVWLIDRRCRSRKHGVAPIQSP